MAVTRIKNNQITDATITGSKFVEKTITGGLLTDNLTYGSNLIVSGNLTINGTTTTVDTTNTIIADPLLVLSRGETSTPSKDSGIIIERGTSDNVGFIWDESADVFAAISTAEDGTTAGNVTIIGYANFKAADVEGSSLSIDNIDIDGNTISSTDTNGNISIVPNGTGDIFLSSDTITFGDLNTNATITTNGTGDLILNTNSGTSSGSITIADGADANISITPNGTGEVIVSTLAITDLTSGRVPYVTTNDAITDSANLTFDGTLLTTTNLTVDNINVDANTITTSVGNLSLSSTGGEVTASSLAVTDLTSGRITYASTSGALVDNANLTFDGTTLTVTGTANVSANLNVTGEATLASATISDLTSTRVTYAGTSGALVDSANLTFSGTLLTTTNLTVDNINVDANTISTTTGNLSITGTGGEVTVNSLAVTDLTSTRITYASTSGALVDSANLTFSGTLLTTTNLTVDNINIDGDTISSSHTTITIDPSSAGAGGTVVIQGNLEVKGTTTTIDSTVVTIADPVFQLGADASDDNLDRGIKALYNSSGAKIAFFGRDDSSSEFIYINDATDTSSVFSGSLGSAAFGSLRVTDLTNGRVLLAGASGEVADSTNLTFDGSTLTVTGVANISSNLNVTGESTLASATISDLTATRVTYASTSGALVDSANLTFSGTLLTTTNLTVDNINIDANTIVSTDTNGNINITPNGAGEVIVSTLAITDLTSGRVPYVTTNDAITDSANLTFNGTDLTMASAIVSDLTSTRVTYAGTSGALVDSANLTFSGTLLTTTNLTVDNINIDSNTIVSTDTNGNINITPNGVGEVIVSTLAITDLTSGRVPYVTTNDAITDSANLTFDGTTLTVTGNVVIDNITIDGNSITSSNALTLDAAASQSIVINEAGGDVDIRFESDTQVNAFFVEGSTGNIGIRTATPNADAALHINTTNSMIVPTGSTPERPTGVTGMVRFNTTTSNIEFYDGAEWVGTGSDFTIFTADDFAGDGSTVAYTLSKDATSAGVIVALNGVVQDPGTAYSVSGTTLTFTEAPASSDNIDVRILTTTAAVTEIADLNTVFTINDSTETATTTINGNVVVTVTNAAVVPGANVTYDLGTSSLRWKDLWLSGTTLALGNLRIKDSSGSLAVFGSDGTTPAATALPSITKSGSNGVGNIGQTDNTFATVYATTFSGVSTTAKYADLAENYVADRAIEPATVVCFGGEFEVTICGHDADRRIAGVISTNPAHLMNNECVGTHVVAVALQGRVPCKVVGPVRKGDMMVSAGNGAARAEDDPKVGSVIGKALENFDGTSGVIEVLVGRI